MGWDQNDEIAILLVDDDAEQRDYLAFKFLERCKCQILNAQSVESALELIARYKIDVMVTDYLMPEGKGTGVDLIKAMGTIERRPPVIMLTTGFVEFLPDETFNQLATVFSKPFSADRLINMALEKLGMKADPLPRAA